MLVKKHWNVIKILTGMLYATVCNEYMQIYCMWSHFEFLVPPPGSFDNGNNSENLWLCVSPAEIEWTDSTLNIFFFPFLFNMRPEEPEILWQQKKVIILPTTDLHSEMSKKKKNSLSSSHLSSTFTIFGFCKSLQKEIEKLHSETLPFSNDLLFFFHM